MSTADTRAPLQSKDGSLNLQSFWEGRLSANPTLLGVGHIGLSLAYNKWMYKLRKAVFLRHVRSLGIDLPNASVLDVGSGVGFWVHVWRSLGVRSLTGSDITEFATKKIAAENPGIRAVQLNIASRSALQTLGTQYDVVSAIDMLYHIVSDEDYASAVANLSGAVKPGGYLVITENFLHYDAPRTPVQANRTIGMILDLVAQSGLTVLKRAPVFILMNYPGDVRSSFIRSLWQICMLPASYSNLAGYLYGAALYPIDLLLTRIFSEGPATEILICRKP